MKTLKLTLAAIVLVAAIVPMGVSAQSLPQGQASMVVAGTKIETTLIVTSALKRPLTLAANTRFATTNGTLLFLDKRTTIAAKGATTVSVHADNIAQSVPKNSTFTVPGLNASLRKSVSAKSINGVQVPTAIRNADTTAVKTDSAKPPATLPTSNVEMPTTAKVASVATGDDEFLKQQEKLLDEMAKALEYQQAMDRALANDQAAANAAYDARQLKLAAINTQIASVEDSVRSDMMRAGIPESEGLVQQLVYERSKTLYAERQALVSQDSPTALCTDSTLSYSAHHSGTCSHHGGVMVWYN